MVELEENVINASFLPNAVLAEMVSNLEPNQVILEEKLLHFIRMKIKKKWISIPMKLLSSTRIV
jgi:hypothetical protein